MPAETSPANSSARRLLAPVALAALAVGTLASAVLSASGAASADYAGPNQPIGTVENVTAPDAGTVEFTGWVADPDALTTNVVVEGVVDGRVVGTPTRTSVARPDVVARYDTGPTPGFLLDVPVRSGNHTACLVARNIGDGLNRAVKCVFTPLGRTPGPAELATHEPYGAITWANAGPGYYHVTGHVTDPDYLARRLELTLYVDGSHAADATTEYVPDWTPPEGAGPNSRFDVLLSVEPGAHLLCITVNDVGPGDDTSLGCRASDTRGRGTGTVTPPPVNGQVVTEAKKHIGQDYVWGAAGPTTFDCSGLVTYSYAKFGISSPHQSELQFRQARVISAARAVPGDLVFYHDDTGWVYHVGIYLSPGKTVAAIDTAEGVNYQAIWNPDTATYGSFTHS